MVVFLDLAPFSYARSFHTLAPVRIVAAGTGPVRLPAPAPGLVLIVTAEPALGGYLHLTRG